MKKINFYFGDPSTYNHFYPVHKKMRGSKLISIKNEKNFDADIGIYGLSTNQIEIFTQKNNKFKILYIESLVGNRLKNVKKLDFDLILVCNKKCKDYLDTKYDNKIVVIGDTFYNEIMITKKNLNTKEYYSIFLSPDDKNMDEQLLDFNNYFDFIDSINKYISQHKIMIRFHPRSSKKLINTVKKKYGNEINIFFDEEISNKEVINKSIITFGIGTTMYYESILNDVPSCFININGKFQDIYSLFVMEEIVLVEKEKDLENFIENPYIKNEFQKNHYNSIQKMIDILNIKN